ncbi:MAG: hypothetical protein ACRCV3_03415 [Desulfovibrionaceae bacterium]
MNEGNIFPARVHYEYEQEVSTRLQYAHGVWGGVTKHGEIELNFYLEYDKLPIVSEEKSNLTSGIVSSDSRFAARNVTRAIHSRVLLNHQTAKAVLEWLEERVQILELEESCSVECFETDEVEQ